MYNIYRFVESIPEGDIEALYWTGGAGWSSDRDDALSFATAAQAGEVSNTLSPITWVIESWRNPN